MPVTCVKIHVRYKHDPALGHPKQSDHYTRANDKLAQELYETLKKSPDVEELIVWRCVMDEGLHFTNF